MGTYSIQIPLDDDGFMRRQCPHCLRKFKWHHGSTADRPEGIADPPYYHCPLCGESAGPDEWWTKEQVTFAEQALEGHAIREATDMLRETFQGAKGWTHRPSYDDEPAYPAALHEPNDMIIVASPCHPWEPVKVPEKAASQVSCLICGKIFAT